MLKILPVVLISLILALISDARSPKAIDDHGVKYYLKKETFFFLIMSLIMAIFVGLRTKGNDTVTYRFIYEFIPQDSRAFDIQWSNLAGAPGFMFVSACMKTAGATFQDYVMLFGLFTTLTYLWFIKKYTENIPLAVYYFITMGVYTFSMAAIKQTAAVAFLAIATDRLIQGSKKKFLFWVAIAELFHPYAFIYLFLLFSFYMPFTRRTWLFATGAIVVSLLLSRLTGSILDITESLGYTLYSKDEFQGAGVNIYRVLVVFVPIVLAYIKKDTIIEMNNPVIFFFINSSLICALIMFVGLFGTANYFARLANYFLIFQVISLPMILDQYGPRVGKALKGLSVVLFSFYFYYDMVLANGVFDRLYSFTTVIDFLRQL